MTPGSDDSSFKLSVLAIPEDLTGKSVVDVGAWDGYFSFECEQRGAAKVLATDHYCWSGKDVFDGGGFQLARRALKSQVQDLKCRVEDLRPEEVGQFDYVLFLGSFTTHRIRWDTWRRSEAYAAVLPSLRRWSTGWTSNSRP